MARQGGNTLKCKIRFSELARMLRWFIYVPRDRGGNLKHLVIIEGIE